jgi:hypothetical protein
MYNSKAGKMKRKPDGWVLVPRELLWQPPICPADRPTPGRLRPLDMVIACALLTAARWEIAGDRHRQARAAGARIIEHERAEAETFRQEWKQTNAKRRHGEDAKAPTRRHTFDPNHGEYYRPLRMGKALRRAGRYGYRQEQKRLKQLPPPKMVVIELTGSALLRKARLSVSPNNLRALDGALDHLRDRVLLDQHDDLSPPLLAWTRLPSGRLRLEVCGGWLRPPLGKVSLPFPTHSAAVLALYLRLFTLDLKPHHHKAIDVAALCTSIGIDPEQETSVWRLALRRALVAVDKHLQERLDPALASKLRAPFRIEVEAIDHRQIRLVAIPRQQRLPEEDEDEITVVQSVVARPRPRPVQRLRLSPEASRRLRADNDVAERMEHKSLLAAAIKGDPAARHELKLRGHLPWTRGTDTDVIDQG